MTITKCYVFCANVCFALNELFIFHVEFRKAYLINKRQWKTNRFEKHIFFLLFEKNFFLSNNNINKLNNNFQYKMAIIRIMGLEHKHTQSNRRARQIDKATSRNDCHIEELNGCHCLCHAFEMRQFHL